MRNTFVVQYSMHIQIFNKLGIWKHSIPHKVYNAVSCLCDSIDFLNITSRGIGDVNVGSIGQQHHFIGVRIWPCVACSKRDKTVGAHLLRQEQKMK